MGSFTITIPLAYIYIPLISFFSYYLLKFVVIKIVVSYLKRKYYKTVRPEILKIVHDTYMYIDEQEKKGYKFSQREYLMNTINERMVEILPKRVKFGGRLDNNWDDDINDCYLTSMEVATKLVFPYWKTAVFYDCKEDIWLGREEILKEHRENSIDNLLNE